MLPYHNVYFAGLYVFRRLTKTHFLYFLYRINIFFEMFKNIKKQHKNNIKKTYINFENFTGGTWFLEISK